VQVIARTAEPAQERLAQAEERLRAAVAQVHAVAGEVLAAAAAAAATAREGGPAELQAEVPRLLTVEQVAERLGISESFAWQLLGRGEITSVRVGRTRRVRAGDLARYAEGL